MTLRRYFRRGVFCCKSIRKKGTPAGDPVSRGGGGFGDGKVSEITVNCRILPLAAAKLCGKSIFWP